MVFLSFPLGGCCGKRKNGGKNGQDFPFDEAWVINQAKN